MRLSRAMQLGKIVLNVSPNAAQANYPGILHSAKVVPSSWFFSSCYQLVSSALDETTRSKVEFIGEQELVKKLHLYVPPHLLPGHLGGTSQTYVSDIDIIYDAPVQHNPLGAE